MTVTAQRRVRRRRPALVRSRAGRLALLAAATVLVAAACGNDDSGGTAGTTAGTGGTTRVEITMKEFAYAPDHVEVPAGVPVEITLRNDGSVEHEWMVGRDPRDGGGYEADLLAMAQIEVVEGEDYVFGEMGETDHTGTTGAEEHHGTEVEVEPGGHVTLRVTFPADAVGTWEMGCFVPGHYEAGMKGTFTVTAA